MSTPTTSPKAHRIRLTFELRSAHAKFARELTTEARDDMFLAARALRADLGVEEDREAMAAMAEACP